MIQEVELSIVTVGMNHLKLLAPFLKSLYCDAKPKLRFELIYVDNCSKDGSVKFIAESYPAVKIIENSIPQGFSVNNNLGVRHSSGKFLAIINPDIVLFEGALDNMVDYMRVNPQIGIGVPKLLNSDLSIQYSVRRFINIKVLLLRIAYKGNDNVNQSTINDYLLKNFDSEAIQHVDWALGAAMFMKRSFFDELNGFDEDYFLYLEDEDLCLRCWQKGYPVVYFPNSIMIHNHQRSSNKSMINKTKILHLKSMITFFKKHKLYYKQITYMS